MRAVVYPYDFEFMSALKYRDRMNGIDIISLLAPKGFGLHGKDAYYLEDGYSGFTVQSTDNWAYSEVDTLIITESITKIPEEERFDEIRNIVAKVNTVINLSYDYSAHCKMKDICKEQRVELMKGSDLLSGKQGIFLETVGVPSERNRISTPVVSVCGISLMTQKFDVQMYLRDRFLNDGYRVSQIGTKETGYLFGFHTWGDSLYDNRFSETEKIRRINQFIKDIETEEKPDIFIIGIPDAMIPYTHKHAFRYGIPAYEILSAFTPDFLVMTLFNGEYTDEFYSEMKNMCNYRYNAEVDCFYNSHFVPISLSVNADRLIYSYGGKDTPDSEVDKVFNPGSLLEEGLYRCVLGKLRNYGEFKSY